MKLRRSTRHMKRILRIKYAKIHVCKLKDLNYFSIPVVFLECSSEWLAWGPCSVTCGEGVRTRHFDSQIHVTQTWRCHMQQCPDTPGGWSHWYWSACSATCGQGIRTRTRTCTHPTPGEYGAYCVGPASQTYECNDRHCPGTDTATVNGGWGHWSRLSHCSVSCGRGTRTRTRTCSNPSPANNGADCVGQSTEYHACYEHSCPVNGGWSHWSPFSLCSATCGRTGIRTRTRTCTHPTPANGGTTCEGSSRETLRCHLHHCPVDGGWNTWGTFGHCSVTCGSGQKTRTRLCSHPFPAHGGADCTGVNSEVLNCTEKPCPVNGGWSTWSKFSHCSVHCGRGTMTRTRTCSNPTPAHNGTDCVGHAMETHHCNGHLCPVNGGWSSWSQYSQCTTSCGGGTQVRTRTCTHPRPLHGGANCKGYAIETQKCSENGCPVNGGWSTWSSFSHCSAHCGRGTMTRTRTCSNPSPAHNGADCVGQSTESHYCNEHLCPVNGEWSSWSQYSQCTTSCGGGTQVRTRTCTHPRPLHGGANCKGYANETQKCSENGCPVNGQWSTWGQYSECTKTCGNGSKTRQRLCSSPAPLNGGKDCSGNNSETEQCNSTPCPVDGSWSTWTDYSSCSVTCGEGIQERERTCTEPPPAHGGTDCVGRSTEIQNCTKSNCPVDGHWSDWSLFSECSKTCGKGSQRRQRTCSNPAPSNGGLVCVGDYQETVECEVKPCPDPLHWVTVPTNQLVTLGKRRKRDVHH
ncbi:SCO-spondin-like isoform X3 [Saccostrea cucullata]|uniref:SCO-spondin-like isoform X3 n=1 Tax=Saccostrea cuccullata TaxID=36930 RepID=UPI002ED4D5DA